MSLSKTTPLMVAVTGGKGGTGKTTVAVNLAYIFTKQNYKVLYLDCDVDAPNGAILLGADLQEKMKVKSFLPKFNENCIGCGACHEVCQPHALLNVPNKQPVIFPEICTGCEACRIICEYNAIEPNMKEIGKILIGSKYGIDLIVGELKVGEPKSAEIVRTVRDYADQRLKDQQYDIVIIDTAPGAHCDIIHALEGTNVVVSVTEPTPFGVHDLKRILELISYIATKPTSKIVINRSDLTTENLNFDTLAEKYHATVIGEIPMSREIQLSYAEGIPVLEKYPESEIISNFQNIFKNLVEIIS
ncbi:MAG: nucleotide-binding protein [Candidatus Helarchaeota archaeon]